MSRLPHRPPHAAPKIPAAPGLLLAVAAGFSMPIQGRINGSLGLVLDDALGAALVSFGTGLVLILAATFALPRGRAGLGRILPALRERSFPPVYLFAGVIGAYFVFAQSTTVGVIGIALFTVAVVTGQTISGLLVDRWGLGPAGRRSVTPLRILSAVLTVGAVAWAVSPRFSGEEGFGWLLPVLLPIAAGFFMSFQQAMNGTTAVVYGTPLVSTLLNFLAGTTVLLAGWLIKLAVSGSGNPLPEQWWYYLGGPIGCVFIALSAVLVRSLGVLLTGLAMIAGQLFGSLALDLLVPAPGTVITVATVSGTLLTLAAIVLATLPWPRRGAAGRPGSARAAAARGRR